MIGTVVDFVGTNGHGKTRASQGAVSIADIAAVRPPLPVAPCRYDATYPRGRRRRSVGRAAHPPEEDADGDRQVVRRVGSGRLAGVIRAISIILVVGTGEVVALDRPPFMLFNESGSGGGMNVVVTGSSGHLGEGLVRCLRRASHRVIGIDLRPSAYTDYVGSVADPEFIGRYLAGADAVLHTATLHKPHVRFASAHTQRLA